MFKILTLVFPFAVNLGYAYAQPAAEFQYSDSNLTISYSVTAGQPTLYLSGLAKPSSIPVIERLIALPFNHGGSTRIILNYRGGEDSINLKLQKSIMNICVNPDQSKILGCQIQTIVPANAQCSSNCIYLFMTGEQRIADPSARFGFHSQYFDVGGIPLPFIPLGWPIQDLANSGISMDWLAAHKQLFENVALTFLSPAALQGSDIVTTISGEAEGLPEQ